MANVSQLTQSPLIRESARAAASPSAAYESWAVSDAWQSHKKSIDSSRRWLHISDESLCQLLDSFSGFQLAIPSALSFYFIHSTRSPQIEFKAQ